MSTPNTESEFDLDSITIHSVETIEKPVVGSPYTRPAEIIVESTAWAQMNQHAREDLRYEAGGIMLGHIFEYEGNTVVRISVAVPAREAVNDIASIQFTYEAWREMEAERRHTAPTEKLVGWYHTHPGFTAFFSGTDHFMHKNFFTQPWHVALVIDPIKNQYSFFRWDEGQVVSCPEFLLEVTKTSSPQTPLNATLLSGLEESAKQLRQIRKTPNRKLEKALRELANHIPRVSSGTTLNDLLPLIVACADLEADTINEARRLLQQEPVSNEPIRFSSLEYRTSNKNPDGSMSIAQMWLAHQVNDHSLHLHHLDANRSFCQTIDISVSAAVRDLTIDQWGNLLMLTNDSSVPISLFSPRLPTLLGRRAIQPVLKKLPITWGNVKPAQKIGSILAGHRYLYLLTKSEIYLLQSEGNPYIPHSLSCLGNYPASHCGWPNFRSLSDWAVDANGNLYLLPTNTKEIWRFNPIQKEWEQLINDKELEQPQKLCVGLSKVSIYDAKRRQIIQYSRLTGERLSCRPLDHSLQQLAIHNIFSDGHMGLYFVLESGIYFMGGGK